MKMKRKRKESCPSPILDDSPKRSKVQAQRKFAQNSGMHSPIMSPIRDLEAADLLPHTSVLREPVELLPMKRPNTEDFLTFLCFRGTPILPSNLQFFNTASIVTDGQVHEIKGDSPKNGPIDISKCAGSSSDKPFIAFGVRKRADPIVISRQMERKRRHALAIQALRRKYQEQKMAKIRALTISKLSEKTTNKTLVKTNTIQKTETVTKKTNTLEKTKVIATKHVKVTTQTLKTKVKPKMCLRSFRGKFVQKELPFRARRVLQEQDGAKSILRTSKNSNKGEKLQKIIKKPLKSAKIKKTVKVASNVRVTRSGSITSIIRNTASSALAKRPQVKRRILLPSTTLSVVKPKLRSTTTKKTVISRRKAQQRVRVGVVKTKGEKVVKSEREESSVKDASPSEPVRKLEVKKVLDKDGSKSVLAESSKKVLPHDTGLKKPKEILKRVTRRDSELANKNLPDKTAEKHDKKEVIKNLELKREVKIAETAAKKEVKKNVSLKKEFRLKSNVKDIKKTVDLKKVSNSILESNDEGQKVKRDVKTVEITVNKIVTRKSEQRKANQFEENPKEKFKKSSSKPARAGTSDGTEPALKENVKKSPRTAPKASSDVDKDIPPKENKKVTRGSSGQRKNAADLGALEAKPTAVNVTKAEPPEEPKIANDKKILVKELTIKKSNKEDVVAATKAAKNDLEEKPLEKTVLKDISEEILVLKKPPTRRTPQRVVDEALSLKTTLKESVVKRASKTHITAQNISVDIPKEFIVNTLVKEESTVKKPIDKDVPIKKTTIESAARLALKNSTACVLASSPAIINSSDKGYAPNPNPKEDLIAKECIPESKSIKQLPDDEVASKEAVVIESTAKSASADDLETLQKSPEEDLIATDEKNKDITSAEVATIILPDDEVEPKNLKESNRKSVPMVKRAPKDEIAPKKVSRQEISAKKNAKDEMAKRKPTSKREEPEQAVQKASPRPSRKTKEAAAIYMEILSHKLVNDSTIDDDNVSIDSFPELPNVKKTEQREIELKAQAKTSKEEEGKCQQLIEKVDDKKGKKVVKGKKDVMETAKTVVLEHCTKENLSKCSEIDSNPAEGALKKSSVRLKSPISDKATAKKTPLEKAKNYKGNNPVDNIKIAPDATSEKSAAVCKKRPNPATIASDSDSDNEVLQAKIRKCAAQKTQQEMSEKNPAKKQESAPKPPVEEETSTRRQTRRSTQMAKESESDSSDESFHIDVRVPRKKKVTRSQNRGCLSVLEKNVDIILEAARVLEGEKELAGDEKKVEKIIDAIEEPKTNSDEDIADEKPLKFLIKDEKKSLPESVPEVLKSTKKIDSLSRESKRGKAHDTVSDSDESTTSDINLKSLQARQRNKKLSKTKSTKSSVKSAASFSDSDEEPLANLTTVKSAAAVEVGETKKKPSRPKTLIRKTADKVVTELSVMEPKAKRECTKRPSNYLPMLSSSDEDDEPYFHGFNTSKEDPDRSKAFVQSLAPSLDLLSKDIGRKGKVNMSNEQIEQWLKDSALAGSSVAKENDAMLKFGEKTAMVESAEPRDEQELKLSESEEVKVKEEPQQCSSKSMVISEEKPKVDMKSPLADRKYIFKKDKTELTPNKNAFSPENECSVYAFGEETEEVISTPFRRPSRRPSSTATSRSEDELSKNDESSKQGQFRKPGLLPSDSEDSRCFNIPQNPAKPSKAAMVPPSTSYHCKRSVKSNADRFPEPFDDFKYKIPSSPSASSGSSAKLYKKGAPKQKGKAWEAMSPVYLSDFPKPTDLPKLVEAPVFHPTDQEFQDPLEYIERIRHKAEQFGICKIVPPSSFKPECKVSDDMRFTAYNQYVHKMLHRWGPNFKEFMVIKKYLATQNIPLKSPPLIGGMEIDLPRLYQTVQSLGGLKEVIEKKKWPKVSDHMKIPKLAQDRVTKLDDIYCKYLLPYDTLSPAEREKLFDEVETCWAKRESRNLQMKSEPARTETKADESEPDDYDSDEAEECTVKSKTMALNAFYRIARNTMSMYFKVAEPTAQEVEQDFWRYVTQKQNHICVHSASIDCGNWGYGFAVTKNSPFARHAWNLKVMSNNSGSVLRSLGPVMGVTIPTLHVGMVFSACCWYRDPHGLPWVEYLHTGGSKIWYGIPSSSCDVFQAAMRKLVPNYCRDKELWLPSDTAMIPPGLLMERNVSLCRTVQEPGQFLVVFPKVFTSSVSTGYVVSESIYFAPLHWLRTAKNLFNDLKNSCEPSMFSLDRLLISISSDFRSSVEVLRVIVPYIEELYLYERDGRVRLRNFGKMEEEKITAAEVSNKKKKMQSAEDVECEVCRKNLFVSMVVDTKDELVYCLDHAIDLVAKNSKMVERFKLKYAFDEAELEKIPARINALIEAKLQKKVPSKYAGLPTLLK